jgi:hypothetical protein
MNGDSSTTEGICPKSITFFREFGESLRGCLETR